MCNIGISGDILRFEAIFSPFFFKIAMNRKTLFPFLFGCIVMGMTACSAAQPGLPPESVVTEAPSPPLEEQPTQAIAATAATAAPLPTAPPAILETRRLTLDWPPIIRAGDSDVIRLTLEVDEQGNLTPTAAYEGHVVTGETVAIPDVFATCNVLAEARLDLAGVEVNPSGLVSETLRPGQRVTFSWSVRPAEVGIYRGTAWFFLRFIPLAGGAGEERALAALPVEIEAVSFFGLHAGPARWLGAVGSFIGGLLGFPFLEDVTRFLFKKVRKRA
jgi:hypothetical protein